MKQTLRTLLIASLLLSTVAAPAWAQGAKVFDRGCGPVATWPRLRLTKGTPKIDTQIEITGSLLAPGRTTVTVIGISNTWWNGAKLPIVIDPSVGPPCKLLVSLDVLLFATSDRFGRQRWVFKIPKDPKLINRKLYLQMATNDAQGRNYFTDGLEITFG